MTSDADFLITGDKDFEEVDNLGSTTIISASEFKALVIDPVADEESWNPVDPAILDRRSLYDKKEG